MKRKSSNLNESTWSGPARLVLAGTILLIGLLLFLSSSRYFDFSNHSGFLLGKTTDGDNTVRWIVILHLISASLLLVSTTFLIFFRLEKKSPILHRTIGKSTLLIGLLSLVPSGLYLSGSAMGGSAGKFLFLSLSLLTLICIVFGYRTAKNRSFIQHRFWMIRFYILLTSALWLRLNMFVIFSFFGAGEKQYLFAVIGSWVPQLLIFEIFKKRE